MIKDELKKEAEEYAKKWAKNEENEGKAEWACYYNGYLAGAEPREKRIEELIDLIHAERKRQEQCDDIHLRKITELEAQIEKMKCCQNCENWNWKHNKCEKKLKGDCFKHSKWVMRNF